MNRLLLSLSLLAAGCSGAMHTADMGPRDGSSLPEPLPIALPSEAELPRAAGLHTPGDYVVYRFSGSYRDAPVSLTHRLVERDDQHMVIDLTIEENGSVERLRLRVDGDSELLSVARIEGQVLRPYGIAAFEQRMSELVPAADDNEGQVGSTGVLIDVGGKTVSCVRTDFRVRIGAHHGVMTMLSAHGFPWQHVGGRIVSDDGSLIYKAEIVDAGHRLLEPTIAVSDEEVYDEL